MRGNGDSFPISHIGHNKFQLIFLLFEHSVWRICYLFPALIKIFLVYHTLLKIIVYSLSLILTIVMLRIIPWQKCFFKAYPLMIYMSLISIYLRELILPFLILFLVRCLLYFQIIMPLVMLLLLLIFLYGTRG